MNTFRTTTALLVLLSFAACGQKPNPVLGIFPADVKLYGNVPYAGDTLKNHLLDVYVPANAKKKNPLIVWVHGGAWNHNDKYADMGYMKSTLRYFMEKGYVLASIDYRFSTQAVFPAQAQDCNQALEYLYQHADDFKIDKNNIVLVGFSAGGHLASLIGLSNNQTIPDFYAEGRKPSFVIRGVIDFYGPSDFIAIASGDGPAPSPDNIAMLLGASVKDRPDLAKNASPATYVDKNDPPFLIIHGEKDDAVPPAQSALLSKLLKESGVKNSVYIVPGAPHYGEMFDTDDIKHRIAVFLGETIRR